MGGWMGGGVKGRYVDMRPDEGDCCNLCSQLRLEKHVI